MSTPEAARDVQTPRGAAERLPGAVLFDMDGTLVNSAPGMIVSLRAAFREHGREPLDDGHVRAMFGPPMRDWLPDVIADLDIVASIVDSYRAHYARGGLQETTVYDGIIPLLDGLTARGVPMVVATSKVEPAATAVADLLGLTRYFRAICGELLDGSRPTKALVVTEALRRLGNPDPGTVLMVGDRRQDVIGACENGLRCAGAGWGYGSPGELAAAGADPIFATPAELAGYLGLIDAASS